MKLLRVLWTFACVAGAAVPHPRAESRAVSHYPGIQFGSNGKLSVTVFSDLHFGERTLTVLSLEVRN